MVIYKNNSDGKGNSYGCHENYLIAREMPFGRIAQPDHAALRHPAGLLRRRQGRLRAARSTRPTTSPYQLSQRADFFEEEIGLETTLKRPIVNTRDEPHCDPQKYRRLHVIVGDANMSEVATYLKVGTTAIVLAMIEDDELGDELAARRPGRRRSARSATTPRCAGRSCCATAAGRPRWRSSGACSSGPRSTSSPTGSSAVGDDVGADVLARWETVLARPRDRSRLGGALGRLGRQAATRRRISRTPRHRARHRPSSRRSTSSTTTCAPIAAWRSGSGSTRSSTTTEVADRDDRSRPRTTRAYFRGRCLQKYPDDIVAANWDSMVFDIGRDPLRRVPMMEPLRGTADHVGNLIDESETAAELLDRLGQ